MAEKPFGDIESLLGRLGIFYKRRTPTQFLAQCPFHDDKTPSLSISDEGLYTCFGCGAKGNWYTLVESLTGMNPYKFLGIKPEPKLEMTFATALKTYTNRKSQEKEEPIVFKIVGDKLDPYSNEECKAYCISRYIDPEDIIKYDMFFLKRGYIGITPFSDRLVIPIHDKEGRIIAYEGRDITKQQAKKCIYPYQSKMGSTIFQNHKLDRSKETIFVEGVLDVITTQKALPETQVSTYFGIQLSNTQIQIVKEFKKVNLMLDPDDAGQLRGNNNFADAYDKDFSICQLEEDDPNESTHEVIQNAFKNRISITEFYLKENDLLQATFLDW